MDEPVPLFPLLSVSRLRMQTDGEGVTTLVAGAGCPLKCVYCINKRLLAQKKPEYVTPAQLFARTRIDNLYFQATGGGVCFGGGEALEHADFIKVFRAYCGQAWKLTAETSLNVPQTAVRTAAQCVDAFIVDVKTLAPDIYQWYTGKDNAAVLKNLRLLASLVPPARVRVRVPLIPGFNTQRDREETVLALRQMGYTEFDLFEYIVRKGE